MPAEGSILSPVVSLRAYPRVHVTLIDCGFATQRMYGGFGMAIDGLPVEVGAALAAGRSLKTDSHLDTRTAGQISARLTRVAESLGLEGFDVEISLPGRLQHVGLGVGTAATLGALQALHLAAGSAPAPGEVRRWSGRGGASGIGSHTFFTGGFAIDFGHDVPPASRRFLPSGAVEPDRPPPALSLGAGPPDWRIGLFLPPGRPTSGDGEVSLFQSVMPIDDDQILKTLAAVYHGVVPAVLTADVALLKEAMQLVRAHGFKRLEVASQGEVVAGLLQRLDAVPDAAVGMSSVGPLVWVIGEATAVDAARRLVVDKDVAFLGAFRIRSTGYEITSETVT